MENERDWVYRVDDEFSVPTQVCFVELDADEKDNFLYGIAWDKQVICGCCGGVYDLDEVEIIDELVWEPISYAIMGNYRPVNFDELPDLPF